MRKDRNEDELRMEEERRKKWLMEACMLILTATKRGKREKQKVEKGKQ